MSESEFESMTDLGAPFGLTPQQFGKLLVQAKLRTTENEPSDFAIRHGLIKYVPNDRNGAPYPIWDKKLTLGVLKKLGLLPETQPTETGKYQLDDYDSSQADTHSEGVGLRPDTQAETGK